MNVGKVISILGTGTAIVLMGSSFFVTDNKKAVHRRWLSLGVLGVTWGLEIGIRLASKKPLIAK